MRFVIHDERARQLAQTALSEARHGSVVTLNGPSRSSDQNRIFHAICGSLEASGVTWAGSERTAQDWKVLLVSGHAVATRQPSEVVVGLEGELVALRESTALMDVARASSLIDYSLAFCASIGVRA